MPEMLGNLGQFFGGSGSPGTGLLDLLGLGTAGAGTIGNIMNQKARSDQLGKISKAEKTLGNPTQLAEQVSAATQPLNEGLVQSVGNTVSGSLAERGLSQAPGIQGTELAQALAPFQQANQQTALQLVLERLGLPIQYAQAYLGGLPGNANISPILAMLMKQGMGKPPSFTGAPDTSGIPSNTPNLLEGFINNPAPPFDPGTVSDDFSNLGVAA